jgi:hypothetical protein
MRVAEGRFFLKRGGEILRGKPQKKAERSSWIDMNVAGTTANDYEETVCQQLGWFHFCSRLRDREAANGPLFPMGYCVFLF